MSSKKPRSVAVDLLIQDYGAFLGIDNLAFDDENLLAFNIEGSEITLDCRSESIGILLKSLMAIPTDRVTPDLLFALHGINYAAASRGMGSVLLDQDFGAWVWIDRIDPRGLTAATLHEVLNRAASAVAFWNREIPDLLGRLAAQTPYEPAADFSMIRV